MAGRRRASVGRPCVTTVAPKPIVTRPWPVRQEIRGSAFGRILRTTDAKQIGIMYMVTSFLFFLAGVLNPVTEQSTGISYRASGAGTNTWNRTLFPRLSVAYVTG